jgi:hypothetical protein
LGEKGASIPSLTSTRGAKCVDGECEFPKSLALKVHPREQLGETDIVTPMIGYGAQIIAL